MSYITLSILFLPVLLTAVSGVKWDELHVKYSTLFGGYWEMPITVGAIENDNPRKFYLMAHDDELNVDLYSHKTDPRFSLMFDMYRNIAGVRIGYIKADIESAAKEHGLAFPYDYSQISMFKPATYWSTPVWYASVLFVHPDKLKAGGRENMNGVVAEGVYVTLDNQWVHVARNECEIEAQGFTKQACFIGMGQHYFYKVTPSLPCNEFQPFFVLYNNGEMIGFGLVPFGSFTHQDGGQKWFENVPRKAVEMIVPNRPQCVGEWVDNFKLTSLHFFLKDHARWTMCPLWGSDRCKNK